MKKDEAPKRPAPVQTHGGTLARSRGRDPRQPRFDREQRVEDNFSPQRAPQESVLSKEQQKTARDILSESSWHGTPPDSKSGTKHGRR